MELFNSSETFLSKEWKSGRKSLTLHPHKYVLSEGEVGLFFFFFLQGEADAFLCGYMCITDYVFDSVFKKKISLICVANLLCYLGNVSEMPVLAGEVKRSSSELKSYLLQTVQERLPFLFHRRCFLLTKSQHNLFPNCDHCTCDPTSKH